MAAHLSKHQRELLLKWIGEGLETDEINKRAAKCNLPFKVRRSLVDHYRKTRKADLDEIKKSGEHSALSAGLALKEERVKRLDELANILWENITLGPDRLWQKDVKSIGSGETAEVVDFETFNAALVREFRGLLDDISKEVGQRKSIVEVSSWEARILAAIRDGSVDFESVVDEFGPGLAAELFRKAGKDPSPQPSPNGEGEVDKRT